MDASKASGNPHDIDQDSDQLDLFANDEDPNKIITSAPAERFRLGYLDVMCLVVNRMIGTGIFSTPQRVMQGTRSTGVTLIYWFAGVLYCLCGTHVYIEYGLTVPRYCVDGVEQSVPRSGGDLNYFQYVYPKPAYRENTVLFSATLFGIAFVALGNMAGNSISFAIRALQASNIEEPSNGAVRGVAIAVATFACFIHAVSRRGGILLSNVLAMIKVAMLLLIIITGILVAAGGLPKTKNIVSDNTSTRTSFNHASQEAGGYAQAFLAIIFAFSGFEQPNYVLGEISRPRRKYPISMATAVGLVCSLYMAVNICYMVVVPEQDQIDLNVAQTFFELTFGRLSPDSNLGERIFNAFLAISSFGNIVVMTYTAARVKQEIAKEGILPWPKFFAQNSDFSLGRLLRWFQRKGWFYHLLKLRWLAPEEHTEMTPVGALVLHFFSCLVLIFATSGMESEDAYTLLTGLTAYVVNAFFRTFLGLGILLLRFRGPPRTGVEGSSSNPARPSWRAMAKGFSPTLSVLSAIIFSAGNLFPVVITWVKPTGNYERLVQPTLAWYLIPAISLSVLGFAAAWWLGFFGYAKRRERKHHQVFTVEKEPLFETADRRSDEDHRDRGGLVQVHETVYLAWVGKESLQETKQSAMPVREVQTHVSPGRAEFGDQDVHGFMHY